MRTAFIGMFLTFTTVTALACTTDLAAAQHLSIAELKAQLRHAKLHQKSAVEDARIAADNLAAALALRARANPITPTPGDAEPEPDVAPELPSALAAVLLADGTIGDDEIAALEEIAADTQAAAVRWTKKVDQVRRRLRRRQQIARWNREGTWWPLIKIAGEKYRVSPAGLRRLMMLESGGRRHLSGTYCGLFQYHPRTWRGTWNPWRTSSIYDGWAQIRATAYALHKGMGPSQWPNTYPRAF